MQGGHALTRILQSATPIAVVAVPEAINLTGSEDAEQRTFAPTATAAEATTAAPGSDGIEATLAAWWQELLGVEHVGLEDDFFDLGGHSLIGVRLFAKIKKTYRTDLELAVLFEARTVRQLGALIAEAQEPASIAPQRAWSTLVPIQPRGTRVPLFCVHAVGGDVLFYEQLAKALGTDQPFYAIRSALITREDQSKTTVEELASIYVSEMRAFYPQGPYLIGGASFGGLIAFEMARQLDAQGVAPALLLMLDTNVPGSEEIVDTSARASTFWKNLREQGLPYLKDKIRVKGQYWADNLSKRGRVLYCNLHHLLGRKLPVRLRYFEIDEAHRDAIARYKYLPYSGKITVIRAMDRGPEVLGKREDPTLGWGKLAGSLELIDVPTRHMFMLFEPYVTTFAAKLKTIFPQ